MYMIHREPTDPGRPNRPPYHYVEGNANVEALLDAADLDTTTYGTREFMQNEGLWDLMEIFSDGELRLVAHSDLANPTSLLQSGENRSEFYEKMTQLRTNTLREDGPLTDEMNMLARFCGTIFASYVERGELQVPTSVTTMPIVSPLDGKTIVRFGQYTWQSSSDVPVIIEYGPGTAGKKFLDAQMKGLAQGLPPFQYMGVSDGPFVNQFLISYLGDSLERKFGRDARQFATDGRLLIGREDGMLQATEGLLATPQPSGTHEMSELILLTGVHKADPRELEATIKLSPRILHPDGKLMLAAPLEQVEPDSTRFSDQLRWAEEAGYVTEWQNMIPTGNPALGKATVSGLAVLHK
jgi:hypothetical protein